MSKIYYVVINGRTLESRNIKLLLSRAVAEKRKLGRKFCKPAMGENYFPGEDISGACADERQSAAV